MFECNPCELDDPPLNSEGKYIVKFNEKTESLSGWMQSKQVEISWKFQ